VKICVHRAKEKKKEVDYYSGRRECDFAIREKTRIIEAVQVCYEINRDDKEKEIEGLMGVMAKFKLKKGLILIYDQEEIIKLKKGYGLMIKPLWKAFRRILIMSLPPLEKLNPCFL